MVKMPSITQQHKVSAAMFSLSCLHFLLVLNLLPSVHVHVSVHYDNLVLFPDHFSQVQKKGLGTRQSVDDNQLRTLNSYVNWFVLFPVLLLATKCLNEVVI